MHPRRISKLRYLRHDEFRSVREEDFATEMKKLHEKIKGQLKDNS